jgi:hypothetical protein
VDYRQDYIGLNIIPKINTEALSRLAYENFVRVTWCEKMTGAVFEHKKGIHHHLWMPFLLLVAGAGFEPKTFGL